MRDNGWRDISTAPMDGSDVLVWGFFPGMQVASFDEGGWCVFDVPHLYRADYFSHWQPLPVSPLHQTADVEHLRPSDSGTPS